MALGGVHDARGCRAALDALRLVVGAGGLGGLLAVNGLPFDLLDNVQQQYQTGPEQRMRNWPHNCGEVNPARTVGLFAGSPSVRLDTLN